MSPHHYPHLLRRWRDVARRAGLRMARLCEADGFPLFYLKTPALAAEGGLYLSAGVHGDEPGGAEGLLAWAEANARQLRDLPLLVFPCLNPWGLVQNTRGNRQGIDLNRCFHRRFPVIAAVKRIVGARRFAASVHLHEDFDGEGLYLYELARGHGWGECVLEAARATMAIDPRRRIDRWHARSGLIRRRIARSTFERMGYPEAVWLFYEHTGHALTIETPSEFALEHRVAAQVAALHEITRQALR